MLFFYFNYMDNIINDKSLILGLMSGTSMDGLDISCARYYQKHNAWHYELIASETITYDSKIKSDLLNTFHKVSDLDEMDVKFASCLSNYIKEFLKKYNLQIDLISSHGHTIFHDPKNGYTKQIGLGSVIAENVGVPVVSNFRQQDIDLGGQGAPLVPIGDKLLFSEYDACINLGGIANISFDFKGKRLAYDISPCNMILNFLAKKSGKDFDEYGKIASEGQVDEILLNKLGKISYYDLNIPKSMGKECVNQYYIPVLNKSNKNNNDILATCVEHIAMKISNALSEFDISKSLLTGGGVFNKYLVARILHHTKSKIIIPNKDLVNFKEAIIFGFLGLLRVLDEHNCLSSATGAIRDHSSGDIYMV